MEEGRLQEGRRTKPQPEGCRRRREKERDGDPSQQGSGKGNGSKGGKAGLQAEGSGHPTVRGLRANSSVQKSIWR